MRAYSVTEFRENLASVLDKAEAEPIVILRNGKCRIPDDWLDNRRHPFFMARAVLRRLIESM